MIHRALKPHQKTIQKASSKTIQKLPKSVYIHIDTKKTKTRTWHGNGTNRGLSEAQRHYKSVSKRQ
jgi:hypothetical protein